jgi:hypothetical protein
MMSLFIAGNPWLQRRSYRDCSFPHPLLKGGQPLMKHMLTCLNGSLHRHTRWRLRGHTHARKKGREDPGLFLFHTASGLIALGGILDLFTGLLHVLAGTGNGVAAGQHGHREHRQQHQGNYALHGLLLGFAASPLQRGWGSVARQAGAEATAAA